MDDPKIEAIVSLHEWNIKKDERIAELDASVIAAETALSTIIAVLSERPAIGYKNAKFYSATENACDIAAGALATIRQAIRPARRASGE